MKALIPSHKENKRYLFIRGKNLKKDVPRLIKEFIGVLGMAETSPRWISVDSKEGILSINRKMLDKVRASLAVSEKKIEIVKVGGTLASLKK